MTLSPLERVKAEATCLLCAANDTARQQATASLRKAIDEANNSDSPIDALKDIQDYAVKFLNGASDLSAEQTVDSILAVANAALYHSR
jgi:hypothetical protein